ncbi:hypothetical protein IJ913_02650 [bacterium]|nr:hypothetical protein [bacterium]
MYHVGHQRHSSSLSSFTHLHVQLTIFVSGSFSFTPVKFQFLHFPYT